MLLETLRIPRERFEAGTGWALKHEGAYKGAVCVPLPKPAGDTVDVRRLAKDMGMPLVKARGHDLWALGPAPIGSRALTTAEAPNLKLPDLDGNEFELASLRGQKVLLYAWAPY